MKLIYAQNLVVVHVCRIVQFTINFGFEYLKIDVFKRTSLLFYLWYFEKYVLYYVSNYGHF